MEESRTEASELVVRLLTRHQEELFRYIFALLPHEADARDVLQETCVALFRKFIEYDAGKPFLPWAYRFAYLEVLKQRERNQRGLRLMNREVLGQLVREREAQEPLLHQRLQALDDCLQALPAPDRQLIWRRYQRQLSAEELARQHSASRRTFFRELERIRNALLECISRRLAAQP